MAQPVILVTGSSGQLGSELQELAPLYPHFKAVFFTRAQLPIDDAAAVQKIVAEVKPNYVINCAAYTTVDKAEAEKELALSINAAAVGVLAKASKEIGAKFLHVSTDYVFDGNSKQPLTEDDAVSPVNFYGETKLRGEKEAIKENPESIIIRTAWVYSAYGKNFVKTMLRLMAEKESINVVADQWGSPTYAADLAKAIMQIVDSNRWQPGIYHFSNEGIINWAQFAEEIGRLSGSHCVVNFISTEQFPTPAKRPLYSVLDKTKIATTYDITPTPWKESLKVCLEKLKMSANLS